MKALSTSTVPADLYCSMAKNRTYPKPFTSLANPLSTSNFSQLSATIAHSRKHRLKMYAKQWHSSSRQWNRGKLEEPYPFPASPQSQVAASRLLPHRPPSRYAIFALIQRPGRRLSRTAHFNFTAHFVSRHRSHKPIR